MSVRISSRFSGGQQLSPLNKRSLLIREQNKPITKRNNPFNANEFDERKPNKLSFTVDDLFDAKSEWQKKENERASERERQRSSSYKYTPL